ncbi:hypothetical protein J437_LFUL014846 [Ladona fulva]|uniref:DNA-directed RNA polymerase III subunit RPC4 n=1 Tax=Ladona fulva TaxID=123851 RepID=A0A8K0P548_LADFU|nr:hypothetical protein J437_LFUL014846 [Ladona fulva]
MYKPRLISTMSIKKEDIKPIENGTQNPSGLLGRPNTISPKRLPSFKPPRDLTLGLPKASLAMTAKSRKKFTPNIPTRRDKSGDASDGKPGDDSSRQGNRGRRGKWEGRGRGGGPSRRNKPVFIQTAGSVFGEGIAEAPKRYHQNSEYSHSREDTGASLVKTKLNLERQEKVDKKEEDLKLQALLKCDFVDDPSSAPDESFRPISIPLLQERKFIKKEGGEDKVKSEGIKVEDDKGLLKIKTEPGWEESAKLPADNCLDAKVVVKEEPDSGDEGEVVHKQKQVVTQPAQKRGLNEYSIMELLESSKNGYVMLQLPTCLPGPKPDVEMPSRPGKSSSQPIDTSKVEESLDDVSDQLEECTLNTLPEGHLGTLRVRASGKAEIVLNGGYSLVVNPATQVGFLQELVSVDLNEAKSGGRMLVLGPVCSTLNCTPDLETMILSGEKWKS